MWTEPSNGGSPITEYRIYVNDELLPTDDFELGGFGVYGREVLIIENFGTLFGSEVQVSAVNAIGEGLRSAIVVLTQQPTITTTTTTTEPL